MAQLSYDLHAHSYYSDGELSPTELLNQAKQQGIDVLALTDHDTTAGLAEAQVAAAKQQIRLISGVEISACWGKTDIHIVGLGFDPEHAALQANLAKQRQQRVARGKAIADKLAKLGIPGAYEGACELAGSDVLGRPHFAYFLVKNGHVKDMGKAFKQYLAAGKPSYVPTHWPKVVEVVAWINAAGGQAVLAHPARYKLTATRLNRLLLDFKTAGGAGLEVITATRQQNEVQHMLKLAQQYRLLASVGSDFHGPSSWANLGGLAALPDNCQPIWSQWE